MTYSWVCLQKRNLSIIKIMSKWGGACHKVDREEEGWEISIKPTDFYIVHLCRFIRYVSEFFGKFCWKWGWLWVWSWVLSDGTSSESCSYRCWSAVSKLNLECNPRSEFGMQTTWSCTRIQSGFWGWHLRMQSLWPQLGWSTWYRDKFGTMVGKSAGRMPSCCRPILYWVF